MTRQIETWFVPGKLPGAAAEARKALSKLAGKVNVHLAMEDRALYPRLKAHPDKTLRQTAEAFDSEMSQISAVFSAYDRKWSEGAIRADAAGFVRETKDIFAALGKRIERENTILYPMVDTAA